MKTGLCLVLAGILLGCSGPRTAAIGPDDDAVIALDGEAGATKRVKAIDRLWQAAAAGETDKAAARDVMKQIIWKAGAPSPVRLAALGHLLSDEGPEAQADNRKLLRLRLPTESQWPVIEAICTEVQRHAGADPAWRELAGALVRSYARKVPVPPDEDRPERTALLALYPGQDIEQIVFNVYLRPQGDPPVEGLAADIAQKQRQSAWELLGRLDPDGARRRRLLAGAPADEPSLARLSRAAAELRVVPITGSELAWLEGIMDATDLASESWRREVMDAVSRLREDQSQGLAMRHLEPLRWAAKHRPAWLAQDRESLLSEAASRLEPRRKWRKSEGLGTGELMSRELLSDWQKEMAWADVLTLLVVDEAIRDPRIAESLFEQAAADRADTSTEYGGVVIAAEVAPTGAGWGSAAGSASGFIARGYAARPAQRVNDRTFVAPDDMFKADGAGGRVLLHYHFHAQTVNNADYAGPGRGDHDYAATHGRACVVLTSVRPGVMNADYYQRGGVQIDLGEVTQAR